MDMSRRTFVSTSLAALAAAAYSGSRTRLAYGQAPAAGAMPGEDGSKLWLRYARINADALAKYTYLVRPVLVEGDSKTLQAIREELDLALEGMLGSDDRIIKSLPGAKTKTAGVASLSARAAKYPSETVILRPLFFI